MGPLFLLYWIALMDSRPKITITFNILLILFSAAQGIFNFAISSAGKDISAEGIILTSLADFVRYLVVMFVTAWFAKEVWNRLVADIFSVRSVAYREAITFVVVLGLFAS